METYSYQMIENLHVYLDFPFILPGAHGLASRSQVLRANYTFFAWRFQTVGRLTDTSTTDTAHVHVQVHVVVTFSLTIIHHWYRVLYGSFVFVVDL